MVAYSRSFGLLSLLIAFLSQLKPKNGNGNGNGAAAPGPPLLPASTPAPWPLVVPSDLPKWPSGWEYDEPPPPEVQQRAGQLYTKLWAKPGSTVVEQTAGRWITYRGEKLRGGKNGVVAYRLRAKSAAPSAVPRAAPAPAPAASMRVPPIEPRYSPGVPQPRGYTPASAPATGRSPSPVPVAPKSPLALPTLRYGSGLKPHAPDQNVKLLQAQLGIAADGQFGKGTLAAVKAFQARKGLAADGIVGPNTWSALFWIAT